MWQFRSGITAFFFQQVLGINPAATNFWTLDVRQVLEAKQQTAGSVACGLLAVGASEQGVGTVVGGCSTG